MALESLIFLSVCTRLILYDDVNASFHVCVLFEVPRPVDCGNFSHLMRHAVFVNNMCI